MGEHGRIQLNIERTIVDETNIRRPQIDSFISHTYYECAYGPKDHRHSLIHKRSTKKGCLARFSIKQLYKFPHIAEVAYYVVEHKRLDGSIAHGPLDPSSNSRKSQYEPRISKALISWVKDQLHKGHTPKYIYEVHKKTWIDRVKNKLQTSKDDFLSLGDIRYYEGRQMMGIWYRNKNDALSVHMWALENQESVFFSQDRDDVVGYPFILGIQMQRQFEAMLRWANHGAISMDATFGTNHMKFHLFTLMVIDDYRNSVPIVWVITSR